MVVLSFNYCRRFYVHSFRSSLENETVLLESAEVTRGWVWKLMKPLNSELNKTLRLKWFL